MSAHESLRVTGSAAAAGVPDTVTIDLSVSARAADVARALHAASATQERVLAALTRMGVPEARISTTSSTVGQAWNPQRERHEGFEAVHRLRVATDPDLGGRVIDTAAQTAGDAFGLEQIAMSLSDRTPLQRQARDDAYADALARATQLATLAGRPLGVVRSIVERFDGSAPVVRDAKRMMGAMESAVHPGETQVAVTLEVEFGWGGD